MKRKQTQRGFGVVEIIIVIVILAIIGVGGWYVWQAQNRPAEQSTPTNGTMPGNQSPQVTDPYAGWKTYCDDAAKACFKHPSDWIATPSSGEGWISARVVNPSNTVAVTYTSPETRDGTVLPFYADGVHDLAKMDPRFKVVGGYTPNSTNSLPGYVIADASLLTTYPLVASEQANFVNTARFTDVRGARDSLTIAPFGKVFTADAAKSWFSSDEAKTSLLIAKSFYLNN